ncbi:MAG: hypothetical protein AAB110_09010 [Candidatus Desantisbacteria bacterium]
MNTINSLIAEIRNILSEKIIQEVKVLDWQRSILKIRLYLFNDLFIQVYCNDRNSNTSFTLLFENERLYARDKIDGNWHRHPFENSDFHNGSPDGSKEVTLSEFYRETLEILAKESII